MAMGELIAAMRSLEKQAWKMIKLKGRQSIKIGLLSRLMGAHFQFSFSFLKILFISKRVHKWGEGEEERISQATSTWC